MYSRVPTLFLGCIVIRNKGSTRKSICSDPLKMLLYVKNADHIISAFFIPTLNIA